MDDLAIGFGVVALGTALLFRAGRLLGRAVRVPVAQAIGLITLPLFLAYRVWLADDLRIAAFLPVSNLIVVGNGTPLYGGFLGGLAWSLIPRLAGNPTGSQRFVLARRIVVVLALQIVGWYALVRPIWGSPPPCHEQWDGEICLQTSEVSCSAACAATLLRSRGIEATEAEMADLCLTRRDGTLWLGLYRGLKRKTAGTPWDVDIIRGDFDDLRGPGVGPAILAAGVPRNAQVARVYTEMYGWSPGEWHSVLFFGFRDPGRVAMGDPTPGIGREEWTEEDLRVLWTGSGLRLVPRSQ